MGFDGIEFLLMQMQSEENSYLQKLKRQAFHAGLDLMGFSTHQGFVFPDKSKRDSEIQKTIHQIELAYQLGIPTMRLNTGRWGTSGSFDELMANKESSRFWKATPTTKGSRGLSTPSVSVSPQPKNAAWCWDSKITGV